VAETVSQSGATKKQSESQQEILDFGTAFHNILNIPINLPSGSLPYQLSRARSLEMVVSTLSSNFLKLQG